MLQKFLLNFNYYFICFVLIFSILGGVFMILSGLDLLLFRGGLGYLGSISFIIGIPLLIISFLFLYFYRKKRNLIGEGIFILLWFLGLIWTFYEMMSIYSKHRSLNNIDYEAFYILGFGLLFLVLMCISFFNFRKTIVL